MTKQLWDEIVCAERSGEAVVRAASLRCWIEGHTGEMHNRQWAKHKRAACVLRRQKISRFRALLLWVSVLRGGRDEPMELIKAAQQFCLQYVEQVEAFFASVVCNGFNAGDLANAVQGLVPDLPKIKWRSTLVGWCDRAGVEFSMAANYSPHDVIAVASVAAKGVGRGRSRGFARGDFYF